MLNRFSLRCFCTRYKLFVSKKLISRALSVFLFTVLHPEDSFITVKSLFEKVPSLFANARATGSHWAAPLLVIRHKLNYWPLALAPHKAPLATSSPCGVLWTGGSNPLSCYCSPTLRPINFISTRPLEDVKNIKWARKRCAKETETLFRPGYKWLLKPSCHSTIMFTGIQVFLFFLFSKDTLNFLFIK